MLFLAQEGHHGDDPITRYPVPVSTSSTAAIPTVFITEIPSVRSSSTIKATTSSEMTSSTASQNPLATLPASIPAPSFNTGDEATSLIYSSITIDTAPLPSSLSRILTNVPSSGTTTATIASLASTSASSTPSSTSATPAFVHGESNDTFSTSAWIGCGVGVSVVLLLMIGTCFLVKQRRHKRRNTEPPIEMLGVGPAPVTKNTSRSVLKRKYDGGRSFEVVRKTTRGGGGNGYGYGHGNGNRNEYGNGNGNGNWVVELD